MTAFTATAADLAGVLAKATGGDTVRLSGAFDDIVRIEDRLFSPPLVIDARTALVSAVIIRGSSGIRWKRGRFRPPAGPARRPLTVTGSRDVQVAGIDVLGDGLTDAAFFDECQRVAFLDNRLIRPRGGVAFRMCDDVRAAGNRVWGWSANAVSLEEVRGGVITGNEFLSPIRVDDTHIDGVQGMQSLRRPNQDLEISGNVIAGFLVQGVFFNVKDGYLQHENVRIIDNTVLTGDAPNGILSTGDPKGAVKGNDVTTLPGSRWQTQIRTDAPVRSGNRVAAYSRWPAEIDQ